MPFPIKTPVLITAIALFGALPGITAALHGTDIQDARALVSGSVTSIRGTVTVPSGAFISSTYDQGFAIEDKTGGIYISTQTNHRLKLGDTAEVTGVLGQSFGLTIVTPSSGRSVIIKRDNDNVTPQRIATGSVNEASEGCLVTIRGAVSQAVSSDLPYGYKFYVNDGSGEIQVFVSTSSNLDLSQMSLGTAVSITGFSGQFDTTYEVQPRIQRDLRVLRRDRNDR
jgi:DNA/RNA endonuclease YhcR with UshA esterase domain